MKLSSTKKVQVKTRLFEVQEGLCSYCGRPMEFESATIDHILPLAKGGTWAKINLTLSHKSCNQLKGCIIIPEWLLNDKPHLHKLFQTRKLHKIRELA